MHTSDGLFNAIVEILQILCVATGLTYSEINILVYSGIVPATWFGIVYLRQRRRLWLLVLHLLMPMVYYFKKRPLAEISEKFYAANIRALDWLAGATDLDYVGISLVIGVVVPILIYVVLCCVSKRWVFGCYMVLIAGNLGWYFWVMRAFQ